jgi:phosphatidylglycerol:prolipoprotein diacylglycerol transferase
MHPILFRIPLPDRPLFLWWALAAVAAVSLVFALVAQRRGDRESAVWSFGFAVAAGAGAYFFRATNFHATALPIYSYGVMLGLSLVVGWYLTLTLAERDGLPKETMANCYVFTAVAAIIGSRILYILTNLSEFDDANHSFDLAAIFALRRGGLVAYGGFIGGLLGSWAFLYRHKIRLMPWADVAVPSLASGLFITRIGCYLFGCDFGTRLSNKAPGWLQKMGTFPHWSNGTLDGGEGSPAFVRHLEEYRGSALGAELVRNNHSFPVHPTQIYESLIGLTILGLLIWQRKHIKFRGQVFFLFVFAYGFCRFIIEIFRDDPERGEYGPVMAEHILIPASLLLFAIAFAYGIALGITNPRARSIARALAFFPPIIAFFILRPASFGNSVVVQLSTSQLIGLVSAVLVAFFYARYWQEARRSPQMAMALLVESDDDEKRDAADDDDEDDEEEKEVKPRAKKKKKKSAAKEKVEAAPEAEEEEAAGDSETSDDDDDEPSGEPAPEG